jgi:hypothetical protein
MRLKNIPPHDFTQEQKRLYETLNSSIERHLQGFVAKREDGALIGPFNALMHFPALGAPVWSVFSALADHSALPPFVREIAILLTGARYSALYELYSHETVALRIGMAPDKVATLAAGQRPGDLTKEEGVAFDVISVLHKGGQIPNTTYKAAVECFGKQGVAELACTAGCYCIIGFLLNSFDVALPGTELAD